MSNTIYISTLYVTGKSPTTSTGSKPVSGSAVSSSYVLPPATTTTLGGIIIGSGLTINQSGVCSVTASGEVSILGIPADNQVAIWTDDHTIEGTTGLTWDGRTLQIPNTSKIAIGSDNASESKLILWTDGTTDPGMLYNNVSGLKYYGKFVIGPNSGSSTGQIMKLEDGNAYFLNNLNANSMTIGSNPGSIASNSLILDPLGHIRTNVMYNTAAGSGGFFGSGYLLHNSWDSTGSYLEIDNVYIRKKLYAYELEIKEISSVGGSLVVSQANGTVYSINGDKIEFDTDGGRNPIQFQVNDIVRAQIWTGRGTAYYLGRVTEVHQYWTDGNTTIQGYIKMTKLEGDDIWKGAKLVQIGNTTDTERQNLIYITSSDSNNPYISMITGNTDTSFVGDESLRIGNLSGVTDPAFGGALHGYGLYADNVYLRGSIQLATPIPSTDVSGLGDLATQDSVDYGDISGTKPPVDATHGATWNSDITGQPGYIGDPSASGLYINGSYMGYYDSAGGGSWKTYMDSSGNFGLGNTNTGYGITWNQSYETLLIRGEINVDAGSTGGWNISNNSIYVGTEKLDDGYSTSGITLASNGSIHATQFCLNEDGKARFSAVDSNLATTAYEDGTLSGTLSHTQTYQELYYDVSRSDYPYDSYISVNGDTYSDVWDTDGQTTQDNFYYNNYSSIPGVTITNYNTYLRFTGSINSFQRGTGWVDEGSQSGQNPIDTITLTGSGGRCEINVDNYTEGGFGIQGVSMLWKGTLEDTAAAFVDIYGSHYTARSVTVTNDGADLIFEKTNGSNFTGTNAITHHTEAFLGNIKVEGNEIYEDSLESDTDSVLKINYHSYGGGDAYNRVTMIGGGRGYSIVNVTGQDLSGLPTGLQVREGGIHFPRRSSAPSNPLPGTVYFYENGPTKKLRCYDGSTWHDLY